MWFRGILCPRLCPPALKRDCWTPTSRKLSGLKGGEIYLDELRRKVILKEKYKIIKQISKFDNELFQLDSGGSRC